MAQEPQPILANNVDGSRLRHHQLAVAGLLAHPGGHGDPHRRPQHGHRPHVSLPGLGQCGDAAAGHELRPTSCLDLIAPGHFLDDPVVGLHQE